MPSVTDIEKQLSVSHYIQVELDWVTYYAAFKNIHGQYPVKYRNRILFPDGWTYSATDLSGPEYPPPDNYSDVWKLKLAYWVIRRKIHKRERDYLRILCENLRAMQLTRSAPLHEKRIETDDTGRQTVSFKPVDVESIETGRLAWVAKDIDDCDQQIKILRSEKPIGLPRDPEREIQSE